MSTELTLSPRLRQLERVIERGMASFVEVGNALLEIRSDGRWEEGGYDSFDDYCRERWGMASSQARGLIREAKAVEEIAAHSVEISTLPANAGQAREIAAVPAGERAEVWAEVVEQHEPAEITAAVIREHVEARKPPAPVEVIEDAEVVDDPEARGKALECISVAVRVAVGLGATSQETYEAYQRGFS
jgi:hypothetical protein